MKASGVIKELNSLRNPSQAALLQRYFKTKPGEYGHGDVFIGLKVPQTRAIAKRHVSLPFAEVKKLLSSNVHEYRQAGVLILTYKFEKANEKERQEIFNFYLDSTKGINNWDLVDVSCPRIIGMHLLKKDKSILYRLAKSSNLWERRISMVSTLAFIVNRDGRDALKIAELHLKDKHDLMHKAVGWMLREVGKRCSEKELEEFLKKHYKAMPRTMLRYAIERFPEKRRKEYLHGKV